MGSPKSISDEPPGDGTTVTAGFQDETFRLRSYQAEMVERSLQENIIVAMDTGSGKTHIALARTAAELELCSPDRLVWFLAPTVTLCEQQFAVFQKALPAYESKFLSGKDNVDHWSDQCQWDAVLDNTRIVLSTHAILLDALTHGFVNMSKLALIIFDEAHHCTKSHPANQIMTNFYKPLLSKHGTVWRPKILGLSASPVMKANASRSGLEQIEDNLNAVTKTPKIHRSELIRFVHKPQLLKVPYFVMDPRPFPLLDALINLHDNYDINSDPWVVELFQRQQEGRNVSGKMKNVFMSRKTYCVEQLKRFASKAKTMYEEIGPSATHWYIHQTVAKFEKMVGNSNSQLLEWTNGEKDHLLKLLKTLPLSGDSYPQTSFNDLSPKVKELIKILVREAHKEVTGLVFIEQRVWVAALELILSTHPQTKDRFSIGTFVGTSQSSKRRTNIADLVETENQDEILDDFRTGKTNIILATSVLEEGIDVSSCHMVICFERPKNLKSFIQRRGRARKQESKYFIFLPHSDGQAPEKWETLEEAMKAAYLDDMRRVEEAYERELVEEHGDMIYKVPSTGALLTLDNALPHLNHFCSILSSSLYVDSRPQYVFSTSETPGDRLIHAEVILPISVDPALRRASSDRGWITERMAKKDAAFQAYKVLHVAGLVNDNLLPARHDEEDMMQEFQIPDHTPSLVKVSAPFDPWLFVATCQQQNSQAYQRVLLKVQGTGEDPFYMVLLTPCSVDGLAPFILYWNRKIQYSVEISGLPGAVYNEEQLHTLRSITRKILHSIHYGRMQEERSDFVWLLAPSDSQDPIWDYTKLHDFDSRTTGFRSASDLIQQLNYPLSAWGLISVQGDQRKYIPKGIISEPVPSTGEPEYRLRAVRVPKRRDFLHRITELSQESNAYTRIELLSPSDCSVEVLPGSFSIFALLFPSILWKCEVSMLINTLRTSLLSPVSFQVTELPLLTQALTSSAASAENNYQRLEFLGDCILKFIASVHLMAANLTWPESYLTGKKGKIVSNGFLARATMKAGLDKFIMTKLFTGAKWKLRYAGDILSPQAPDKDIFRSSKLLADVIESLIGASYVKGGFPDAFLCVQTLLPMEAWTPIPEANTVLFNAAPTDISPKNLSTLEKLIGYTFSKKMLLLEALTHASYTGPNAHCSYERLEFLGDAVLDYIVSIRLFEHKPKLPHPTMHEMRTSMVNASFLAFRMFETTLEEENTTTAFEEEIVHRALWQYMRHSSPTLTASREVAITQHKEVREQILHALNHDKRFPWHLLSLTDVPKFLSDIVESVIGAIYIDSQGSIEACEIFVGRLGILGALEHILRNGIDCLHPKERLGHLAVEKSVHYVKVEEEKDGGSRAYRCQVKVGGENVGGVVEGIKRLNAETIAAWKAVNILESAMDVDMEMSGDEEWHDADE